MADAGPPTLGRLLARLELRADGATPDAEPECERCDDRGWIVVADGGAGVARPCECRVDARVPKLLAAARIPPRFLDKSLDDFEVWGGPSQRAELTSARAAARQYVEGFLTDRGFRGTGLLFIGRPGVGKTHLAVGVLRRLIEQYKRHGLFVDFTSLLHEIRSTFDPRAAESQAAVLHPVTRAEVAVIDDLGAQKSSDWVREILYLILNTRYANRLPTLFTTNYRLEPPRRSVPPQAPPPDDDLYDDHLAGIGSPSPRWEGAEGAGGDASAERPELLASDRLPPTLVSRLHEMTEPVVIEAGDYRRERRGPRTE
ncbi:MAG: ATP-binding protein [Thermoanaerobaculia bacterium]|nr:ATP-binding protein [Thermoanaerobaculia bacterium]